MSTGPEQFIVVSFGAEDDIFAVTTDDGSTIIQREYDAIKDSVHGVLSTEDEIESAENDVRYAVPVDLAREVFGWDL